MTEVKKKTTNATTEILKYMKSHDGISQKKATDLFGVTRLSSIIFNLKKQGNNIDKRELTTKTRFGKTTRYAEYFLVE